MKNGGAYDETFDPFAPESFFDGDSLYSLQEGHCAITGRACHCQCSDVRCAFADRGRHSGTYGQPHAGFLGDDLR